MEPETPNFDSEFERDFKKLQAGQYSAPYADFRRHGILTFWVLPLLYGLLAIGLLITPGFNLFWFLLVGLSMYYPLRKNKEIPKISNLIYRLALISFGIKIEEKNSHQIRTWWFLLFTPILSLWILLGIVFLSVTLLLIPFLFILWKNKYFRKVFFSITFLPRSEYITFHSLEEKRAKKEYQDTVLHQHSEYFQFYKPTKGSRIITYLAIFLITYFMAIFIYPVIQLANSISNTNGAEENILAANRVAGVFFTVGIVSFIPYFLLAGPIKKLRLTRLAAFNFSRTILKGISGTFLNLLPMFKGEYFVEKNSKVLDMRDNYSFFQIFRSGRLLTILFIPIVLISFTLGRIVKRVSSRLGEGSFDTRAFLTEFFDVLRTNPETQIMVFFVYPIIITILLPMIFALNDAEIKRAVWEFDDEIGITDEIDTVEDIGQTLNNQFKLILGAGTITSIFFTISSISNDSTIGPIAATLFVVIAGATMVLPGTLFLVYRYISTGDHAYAVNALRYHVSREDKVGVGTITRHYFQDHELGDPPKHIAEDLGIEITSQPTSVS